MTELESILTVGAGGRLGAFDVATEEEKGADFEEAAGDNVSDWTVVSAADEVMASPTSAVLLMAGLVAI